MPRIVGVIFHTGGKIYNFDAGSLELARGDQVVVETARGLEMGEVVSGPLDQEVSDQTQPLKPVLRRAGSQDLETVAANRAVRTEALATCRQLIVKHGLDMKLVDAEVMFGGGKIVFSFYADERVDFRALVVDLAKALRMRIELRQIGVRDEARMFGGLGPCGRHLCCALFQVDQEPVSIRMAKEQNLPLNPMKISGLCGRLMCCLKYEQEQYVAFRKVAPKRGTPVRCSHGDGVVAGYQVPKDAIVIKMADGTMVEEKAGQVLLLNEEGGVIGTAISIDEEGVVTESPLPEGEAVAAGQPACPGCRPEAAGAEAGPCPGCSGDLGEAAADRPEGQEAAAGSVGAARTAGTSGAPGAEGGEGYGAAGAGAAGDAGESSAGEPGEASVAAELEENGDDTEPGQADQESAETKKRRPRRRRRRPRGRGENGAAGGEPGSEPSGGPSGEPAGSASGDSEPDDA